MLPPRSISPGKTRSDQDACCTPTFEGRRLQHGIELGSPHLGQHTDYSKGPTGCRAGLSPDRNAPLRDKQVQTTALGKHGRDWGSLQTLWQPFNPPYGVFCTVPSRYLCAIGIAHQHLALEGLYLPSSASIIKLAYSSAYRGHHKSDPPYATITLIGAAVPNGFGGFGVLCSIGADSPHLPGANPGFRDGLIGVHSQLLTESLLISFCIP